MQIGKARELATGWVLDYAKDKEISAAFFSGSTIDMEAWDNLPETSDVDILLVTGDVNRYKKPGKFLYDSLLIEASFLAADSLQDPEAVMRTYEIANSFKRNTILFDKTGDITRLSKFISDHFREKNWIKARYGSAITKVKNGIAGMQACSSFEDKANACVFPAGICTHVILVAALKNATVRLRYLRAKEVLEALGFKQYYPFLLELLGCEAFAKKQVQAYLDGLALTFDRTVPVSKTKFPFSNDITAEARNVAINGSQALINAGYHREAVFWIAATYIRCHKILSADAPELQRELSPFYMDFMNALGLQDERAMEMRCREIENYLPKLEKLAEEITEMISDTE